LPRGDLLFEREVTVRITKLCQLNQLHIVADPSRFVIFSTNFVFAISAAMFNVSRTPGRKSRPHKHEVQDERSDRRALLPLASAGRDLPQTFRTIRHPANLVNLCSCTKPLA
jgi:hypothetical protein